MRFHAGTKSRWIVLLVGLLALATPAGCEQPAQSNLPTVRMTIGSRTFTLEVAGDDASRENGLMRRDSMPDDHGMIFVFPDEDQRQFWMHNTRIPLDILYLDAHGAIVSIKQMQAYDERTTPSDKPAKYAIELNAGAAGTSGVKVGQALSIPQGAREALDSPSAVHPATNPTSSPASRSAGP